MFKLTIRTPYETILETQAKSLYLSSEGGDMQVFENHASITAALAFSPIVIETEEKEESYLARNGMFLFDNEKNEAFILALYCEQKSEVSHQTIKDYAAFIEKQLEEGKDLSDFQVLYLKGEKLAVEEQLREIK